MSSALRNPLPSSEQTRSASDVRLSVEQVSYAYAPNPSQAPLFTLEALSFHAKPGEIVAILGPNASGKSTLLKLISGALEPLSGRIILNGFVTHSLTPRTRASASPWCSRKAAFCSPRERGNLSSRGAIPTVRASALRPKTM